MLSKYKNCVYKVGYKLTIKGLRLPEFCPLEATKNVDILSNGVTILWGRFCTEHFNKRTFDPEKFVVTDIKNESDSATKHKCTCDFYTVLLRSGCKCGGM